MVMDFTLMRRERAGLGGGKEDKSALLPDGLLQGLKPAAAVEMRPRVPPAWPCLPAWCLLREPTRPC